MPRFNYVALDSRGQEATGLVEATSTNDAIGRLRQAGYFPTSVYEEAIARSDGQSRSAAHGEDGTDDEATREKQHCSSPAHES